MGQESSPSKSQYFIAQIILTQIYCLSGRYEETRAQFAEVLRIQSKFTLEKWAKRTKGANREKILDSMRKAGLKRWKPNNFD
jgi:hypothetical protein